MKILEVMHGAIAEPRAEVDDTAPKIVSFEIPMDKIGEVIGPKGKVINAMQQETGADINVDDDGMVGTVTIGSKDGAAVAEARRRIELILDPPRAEVGDVYTGKVVNITKFGAFVNILPGRDGLVHISKLGRGKRVERVEDVVSLGDDIDRAGRRRRPPGQGRPLARRRGRRGRARRRRRPSAAARARALRPRRPRRPSRAGARRASVRRPTRRAGSSSPSRRRSRREAETKFGDLGPGRGGHRRRRRGGDGGGPRRNRDRDRRPAAAAAVAAAVGGRSLDPHHPSRQRPRRSSPRPCPTRARSRWGSGSTPGPATRPGERGASHFLEHLLFKGTATRSAKDIAEAIDAVGGDMNAFTTKEYTAFYTRLLDEDLELGLDILSDIMWAPAFRPEEVEAERQVILEEILMHEDEPSDLVHEVFHRGAVPRPPAGPGGAGRASRRSRP